ncbi:hypothetical protein [Saccharomonospora saliphila]|uniref:hypothetical protein n=1 Tax=Saccharomonospora saliphila TaxID=369829 RepID=UPI00036ADD39|nr:hypothetical protein [Saccharomonospora saliphila]
MDPLTLAGQAVSFLCAYLTQVASGLVQRTQDSAAEALYNSVASRLRQTAVGERAWAALEASPQDTHSAHEAQEELAREAQSDWTFANELRQAVQNAWQASDKASRSNIEYTTVTASGAKMKNSVVTNSGNVDQSTHRTTHRTKFSFGGFAVIAAILLVGGSGAVVAITTGSGTVDADSIGDAPGAEGLRETGEAVLGALTTGNAELMCDLYTLEAVTELEVATGRSCKDGMDTTLQRIPSEARNYLEEVEVLEAEVSGSGGSPNRGEVVLGTPDMHEDDMLVLDLKRELNRWRADPDRTFGSMLERMTATGR